MVTIEKTPYIRMHETIEQQNSHKNIPRVTYHITIFLWLRRTAYN